MDDMLSRLKEVLEEWIKKYEELAEQIRPLQEEMNTLQRKINTAKELISLETGRTTPDESDEVGKTKEKSTKDAFKELIQNYFVDRDFRENEVRKKAVQEGLDIKGKPISPSYSRSLVRDLYAERFLEKVRRGVYRLKSNKKSTLFR